MDRRPFNFSNFTPSMVLVSMSKAHTPRGKAGEALFPSLTL
jgi:hypothetical protein